MIHDLYVQLDQLDHKGLVNKELKQLIENIIDELSSLEDDQEDLQDEMRRVWREVDWHEKKRKN